MYIFVPLGKKGCGFEQLEVLNFIQGHKIII
jgi:hypothetical protein